MRSIAVRGNERLEPETVRAYANLTPGDTYPAASLDTALKDLYATELFADVVITGAETGHLVIAVRENPVINRIVLEGNKRLSRQDPARNQARSAQTSPLEVRADVERIVELYRREGASPQSRTRSCRLRPEPLDLVSRFSKATNEGSPDNISAIISWRRPAAPRRCNAQEGGLLVHEINDSYDRTGAVRPAKASRILSDQG